MKRILFVFFLFSAFCVACRERNPWPPETSGPNLPVRYCDINKREKDTSLIGYVFVDTDAVNWMIPIIAEDTGIYTPDLSDLLKTERILQREYPTILKENAYDEDGHLFEEGGLRNYARQYLFLKGPEGKRYVYIIFVHLSSADLEDKVPPFYYPNDFDTPPPPPSPRHALSRYWLIVDDGGDSYWRVFLDLDNEKVVRCFVNGMA